MREQDDLDKRIRRAIDARFSGVTGRPGDAQRILQLAKGEEKPMKKFTVRTAALILALLLALAGTAWALESWGITNFLSDRYNEKLPARAEGLIQTEFSAPSLNVGDVTFTLREMLADEYVGTAIIECKAPAGKYLFTDLVQMTAEEWQMSEKDYISKYGDYYWLLDSRVSFMQGEDRLEPPSEYAVDGERESENVIVIHCTFPALGMNISDLSIGVSVRHVTSEDRAAGERFRGDFKPGYQIDPSAYQSFKRTIGEGLMRDVTVTITPILLHAEALLQNAPEGQYALRILDADGREYAQNFLSTFAAAYGDTAAHGACAVPQPLPESVFLQLARIDASTGDCIPVGERVEIALR